MGPPTAAPHTLPNALWQKGEAPPRMKDQAGSALTKSMVHSPMCRKTIKIIFNFMDLSCAEKHYKLLPKFKMKHLGAAGWLSWLEREL